MTELNEREEKMKEAQKIAEGVLKALKEEIGVETFYGCQAELDSLAHDYAVLAQKLRDTKDPIRQEEFTRALDIVNLSIENVLAVKKMQLGAKWLDQLSRIIRIVFKILLYTASK